MKSVVLTGEKGVEGIVLEERPAPTPGPGEVRIRMRAHTLNHIDIWVLSGSPAYSVPCPHIMGSEGVGTVESLGVGVDPLLGLSPGQTVAISPGQGCLVCELCRSGSESLCPSYRVLGGHLPGIFSEVVCLPASRLIPVPDGVDALSASAVTLAGATAHQALVVRGLAKPGEKWLVVGASGGVGHLACLLGKALKIEMVGTYGPERKREPLSRGLGIPLVSHEAAD
nr:alcohol dehydrogenase catalytic domain-containing protein [Nitrospiraceae bacterium]